jgi:hypothetical protein
MKLRLSEAFCFQSDGIIEEVASKYKSLAPVLVLN